MITCPSCSHENVAGTQFCEMCGEELADASTAAPASGAAMVKCPNCSFENPADNIACEACGTALKPAAPVAPPVVAAAAPLPIPSGDTTSPFDALLTPAIAPGDVTTVPDIATATATPASPDISPSPVVTAQTDDALAAASPFTSAPTPPTPIASATPIAAATPATTLTPGQLKLVVEQGQTVGAQFVLGDTELLVGREDEDDEIYPDIDLSDQDAGYVHRRHATLKFENGGLFVTHLGGANKTRLNNKPVPDNAPTAVSMGDKLGFGKVVVRVMPL